MICWPEGPNSGPFHSMRLRFHDICMTKLPVWTFLAIFGICSTPIWPRQSKGFVCEIRPNFVFGSRNLLLGVLFIFGFSMPYIWPRGPKFWSVPLYGALFWRSDPTSCLGHATSCLGFLAIFGISRIHSPEGPNFCLFRSMRFGFRDMTKLPVWAIWLPVWAFWQYLTLAEYIAQKVQISVHFILQGSVSEIWPNFLLGFFCDIGYKQAE